MNKQLIIGIVIGMVVVGLIVGGFIAINSVKANSYNQGAKDASKYDYNGLVNQAFSCKPLPLIVYNNQTKQNMTATLIAEECLKAQAGGTTK